MNDVVIQKRTMELTEAEIKLILRIRLLRKQDQTVMMLVTARPLTVNVVGNFELLEKVGQQLAAASMVDRPQS